MTADEREDLLTLIDHPGWKIMQREMANIFQQNFVRRVVNYQLETGEEKQLAYLKCQAEGVQKFITSLAAYLQKLQDPKKK